MTIEHDSHRPCPLCGGDLAPSVATIPFVLGPTVVVVKGAPAEVCGSCGEAFLDDAAADDVTALLRSAQAAGAEVVVVSYRRHDTAA